MRSGLRSSWGMFELYANGEYSIRGLQAHVTKRGLTSRKGNQVMRSSVAEMLKNPFYYGDFIWSGKQYHGKHPPIIDKALFDRVQAVISSKNRTRDRAHGFAYTGLLKCAECGGSITAEIKKDRYIYYHCTFDKGRCGGERIHKQSGDSNLWSIRDRTRTLRSIKPERGHGNCSGC